MVSTFLKNTQKQEFIYFVNVARILRDNIVDLHYLTRMSLNSNRILNHSSLRLSFVSLFTML